MKEFKVSYSGKITKVALGDNEVLCSDHEIRHFSTNENYYTHLTIEDVDVCACDADAMQDLVGYAIRKSFADAVDVAVLEEESDKLAALKSMGFEFERTTKYNESVMRLHLTDAEDLEWYRN